MIIFVGIDSKLFITSLTVKTKMNLTFLPHKIEKFKYERIMVEGTPFLEQTFHLTVYSHLVMTAMSIQLFSQVIVKVFKLLLYLRDGGPQEASTVAHKAHLVLFRKLDQNNAELGIESVGHIGKDRNDNRSK